MLHTILLHYLYTASSKQRANLRRSVTSEKKKLCTNINDYNALGVTIEGFHQTSIETHNGRRFSLVQTYRLATLPCIICVLCNITYLLKSEVCSKSYKI